jgi:hypothetical protein
MKDKEKKTITEDFDKQGSKLEISAIYSENMKEKNSFEKVEAVVSHILQLEGMTSSDTEGLFPREIKDKYDSLKIKDSQIVDINPNTFSTQITECWKDDGSKYIWKNDKNKLYFNDNREQESRIEAVEEGSVEQANAEKSKEKDLYPIFEDWLKNKVTYAIDSSSKTGSRNYGSRVWQNPDILGVKFNYDIYATRKYTLTSIEIKQNSDNWQRDIFEAVSHSMFTHYTYFAFMRSGVDQIDKAMKIYAHEFKIGILYLTNKSNDKDSLGDDWEIIEYVPAPYHEPNIEIHDAFLKAHEIKTIEDLEKFFSEN